MEYLVKILSLIIVILVFGFIGALIRFIFIKEKRSFWLVYTERLYLNYVIAIGLLTLIALVYLNIK
ncbi:hypothetical protein SAMN04488029_3196 [Reichenbachiella faecimaris]|uniref:Uncharacterized protein n=1 Tax=Reichenbachiella faecimaris TaxID=692418 RepID=A0A1W2GK44_REIFA|nr:hypothetical protein SAMN04488029_3196 [Reichenbachiella faecimaris]